MPAMSAPLPADDPERALLHDEVHARPSARVTLPALVVHVAVLHAGVARATELAHLQRLPGQDGLTAADLRSSFARLSLGADTLTWERHTEFTSYSLIHPLPQDAAPPADDDVLPVAGALPAGWLAQIPGRTVAAIALRMLHADIDDAQSALDGARRLLGPRPVVASLTGRGHSIAATDFGLREDGFEHVVVLAPPQTSDTRAGRIAQRLLEVETYRMMALRGLPVAKSLAPMLGDAERALADITARLEAKRDDDEALLDTLVALAARIERATAEHMYRFSATAAYAAIVAQRLAELRELPIAGTQTIGEFMQRRLSPAIATVASTAQRLSGLSQRVERTGALLRTRVDIATEARSRQLLERLTRGQAMQLQLQTTVEGLSIAAISYYVVSLVLYGAKAAKAAGMPLHPELTAGLSIPFVLAGVAWLTRRIHRKLHG